MRMPTVPAVEQIVRSSSDAPSAWKKRRSIDEPCSRPIVPAYQYGRIACGPSLDAAIAFSRVGDLVERLVPRDRARSCPLPLGPTRRSGVQQPVGVIRALEVAGDLRAEEAARERMVRIAGDADRAAVLDRDEHRAGVGAVVRTGAAHDAIGWRFRL